MLVSRSSSLSGRNNRVALAMLLSAALLHSTARAQDAGVQQTDPAADVPSSQTQSWLITAPVSEYAFRSAAPYISGNPNSHLIHQNENGSIIAYRLLFPVLFRQNYYVTVDIPVEALRDFASITSAFQQNQKERLWELWLMRIARDLTSRTDDQITGIQYTIRSAVEMVPLLTAARLSQEPSRSGTPTVSPTVPQPPSRQPTQPINSRPFRVSIDTSNRRGTAESPYIMTITIDGTSFRPDLEIGTNLRVGGNFQEHQAHFTVRFVAGLASSSQSHFSRAALVEAIADLVYQELRRRANNNPELPVGPIRSGVRGPVDDYINDTPALNQFFSD